MKTDLTPLLLFASLCGCAKPEHPAERLPDPNTPKIAALEARCSALESNYERLRQLDHETSSNVAQLCQVVQSNLAMELDNRFLVLIHDARLDQMQSVLSNYFTRGQAQVKSGATPGGTRDGVPADVYNAIAEAAKREWPGDYKMQAYRIKTQVEAYKNLHR